MTYGPNMTKLITKFIPRNAVPRGGGFADGAKFFTDKDYRKTVLDKSEADALEAIRVIHTATDDPYKDYDEEIIARIILDEIEKREAKK
jgi:hypothetical protein